MHVQSRDQCIIRHVISGPTPVFLPAESHGQRSLVGTVHGVTKVRHDLMIEHIFVIEMAYSSANSL